jgi:ABC-type transport system involved in multi-copper enzyme maturation permease subunit
MSKVMALSGVVIKEMYRRKDFYVLLVLTVVLTLLMASARFFNDTQIVRILKETCMWLIWISALVIAIVTTARQIPSERENRTIFPLLAKPVSRWQVILGKFFGCWFACGIALVVFYIFFGAVTASREHHLPVANYLQLLVFHWAMLGVVIAFVLFGSLVFAAPSSNATISFVCITGILVLGKYLNGVASSQPQPLGSIIYAVYFVIPHLEFFDIRQFALFDRPIVPWIYWSQALVYAVLYAALLLVGAWLVFRRKALNT